MMKTEYTEKGGFLQRDGVEHQEYAEAYSTECQKVEERDGADLLEKVLDRDNLNRAYKRVKANKGASGIDGMTVEEALPWLKEHRDELLESIRNGKYKPSPVRRVEIPKDNGGVRNLGIPTVIDRIIQQAIAQVLTPIYEPKFSDGSYGYRPHRSAKDAILKVKEYADEGYKFAVCLDLSKYFDTLCHELLMNMLRQDIKDKRLIDLIFIRELEPNFVLKFNFASFIIVFTGVDLYFTDFVSTTSVFSGFVRYRMAIFNAIFKDSDVRFAFAAYASNNQVCIGYITKSR